MTDNTTDFGFQRVKTSEKQGKVNEVFNSVASRYDLMNDLMSAGIRRLWKKVALSACQIKPWHQVLDVATGTGDLALKIAPKVADKGALVCSDINENMLRQATYRLIDKGLIGVDCVLANAEKLPFANNHFDRITISFGLRNVTDKAKALTEFYRVLKPGGKCVILEFSTPLAPSLKKAYDLYSFKVLPKMGELVTGDRDSYQYLAESIRRHPHQEALKTMLLDAGFDEACYQNLTGGIVAIHQGMKY